MYKLFTTNKNSGGDMYKLFTIALLLSLLLSACAAVHSGTGMTAIGASETISGMRRALGGAPGTFVMQGKDAFLLAWPRGSSYAFTVIGNGSLPAFNSTRANPLALTRLVQDLEADGWKITTPAAIPAYVADALKAYTIEAVMAGSQTLPTILVIPVIIDFAPPVPPQEVS